jgi:TonB family protein
MMMRRVCIVPWAWRLAASASPHFAGAASVALVVAALVVCNERPANALLQPDACAPLSAVAVSDDRTAALITIWGVDRFPPGIVTAFGATSASGNPVDAGTWHRTADGIGEASFVVRTDAPILGVTYRVDASPCTMYAHVAPRRTKDDAIGSRPVVELSNEKLVSGTTCARPYSDPQATRADPVEVPRAALDLRITGTVRVLVSLDDRGTPVATRILSSPSAVLNAAAQTAAKRSSYQPEIFRCESVPSAYIFSIELR